eukprot:4194121-Pyramimonas_sp.AAC.1
MFPKAEGLQAALSQGKVGSRNFSLESAMGYTRLPLRSHRLPSSNIWAPNCLITGTRAPMCSDVTDQIRIGVLLQPDIPHYITYP